MELGVSRLGPRLGDARMVGRVVLGHGGGPAQQSRRDARDDESHGVISLEDADLALTCV
ncbi:hypothetical protein GALL_541860 [mine drainage metagenome]|uniref:Uncharacterized protein n=1 Tax=mine drainage metagenome TaxID=410659 RepID=A0A1J5P8Y3_9ZZZZ